MLGFEVGVGVGRGSENLLECYVQIEPCSVDCVLRVKDFGSEPKFFEDIQVYFDQSNFEDYHFGYLYLS